MTIKSRIGKVLIPLIPVSRESFDILRLEWNAALIRAGCRVNPIKISTIRKYTSQQDLSVNIGAGPFGEPGWVNIDLFKANNISFTYDCRRKLPFKEASVARIRCEHVFEHLDRMHEAPSFLKECYRSLQPGGTLRIIVPDAEKFLKAYSDNTFESWREVGVDKQQFCDSWQPMDAINKIFHQGGEHKFGYDFGTLRYSLQQAGFNQIKKVDFGESDDPFLVNDQPNHREASLYVECRKL